MPRLAAAALSLVALAATLAPPRAAPACGMFALRGDGTQPSIAVERVVLIHDEDAGVEHLLREIAFTRVDRPFGFVVPTPSRPSVLRADNLDWTGIERAFPFAAPEKVKEAGLGFGSGHGRLGGAGIRLLEAKPLGSFAAYVLQASDGKAMKGWLDRNQFSTTPASEAWLDRYSRLGFHFVALRFDPGLHRAKNEREGTHRGPGPIAETLRISFDTPVPFYPYREPDRDDLARDRAFALWLVTRGKPKIPVALVKEGDSLFYKRPWQEGVRRPPMSADSMPGTLGKSAWSPISSTSEAVWQVQVFEDQKRSRKGFGDVLLVPDEPRELDAAAMEKRRALLPLLDPGLEAP